jgi:hypothetical protein
MRLRGRPTLLVRSGILFGDSCAKAASRLLLPPLSGRVSRGTETRAKNHLTNSIAASVG